jgi:hypothetical protein
VNQQLSTLHRSKIHTAKSNNFNPSKLIKSGMVLPPINGLEDNIRA